MEVYCETINKSCMIKSGFYANSSLLVALLLKSELDESMYSNNNIVLIHMYDKGTQNNCLYISIQEIYRMTRKSKYQII